MEPNQNSAAAQSAPDGSVIRLGLIGDNIGPSQAPLLHELAGRLTGLRVVYERLVPGDLGLDFDALFERCRQGGYRGINVTYPYKERVVEKVVFDAAIPRAMGACNTVVFAGGSARGYNTDCSGFRRAFRNTFGDADPGVVALAGAGGVGKAIAFALGGLGATELRLFDSERSKSAALRDVLSSTFEGLTVEIAGSIEEAAHGADGLVNGTPLGMTGHAGSAFPKSAISRQSWAFDAVYTPVETAFLRDVRAAGVAVMSGYELFLFQGVDAFEIFTGHCVDEASLRDHLRDAANRAG